jgi:F420-dependent oxidoreductase-like protein
LKSDESCISNPEIRNRKSDVQLEILKFRDLRCRIRPISKLVPSTPLIQENTSVRFGVFTSLTGQTWQGVSGLWRHIEATGWDTACVSDHFMPNTKDREGAVLESWSTLSALAPAVPRIRVGTIVLGNTYRHPAVVAKMAAQVDIISNGRLILGMGAGWQRNEHEAYGIPFYTMRERLERLDEACEVIRSLWTVHRANFKGRYYQLSNAPLEPKPVQKPHPELMIGGSGERVTLRIVAKHADHWNVWGGPKVLARKSKVLEEHCANVGRDSRTIMRSVNMALLITNTPSEIDQLAQTVAVRLGSHAGDARDTCLAGSPDQIREQLHELKAAGANTIFIPTFLRPLAELGRDMDTFIAEIAPEFRA